MWSWRVGFLGSTKHTSIIELKTTEYDALVSVSPVTGLTTGESVVTPNVREFHFLPGGLFVA